MPLPTQTGSPKIDLADWNEMVGAVNTNESGLASKADATATTNALNSKANVATTPFVRRWTGSAWSHARPDTGTYPAGMVWSISTNDVAATAPGDGIDGDPWIKHEDAV